LKFIGELLDGRFRISGIIGEGGMGVVFEAIDVETGDPVAVKVLHPNDATSETLRRFQREARAANALRHPNICQVFGFGKLGSGSPYLVMERLRGETLRSRMRDQGKLPVGDAVAVTLQLLEALTVAHARGVLHRDVKPSNIFAISRRGDAPVVKLIDFGLVKLMPTWTRPNTPDDHGDYTITKTGVVAGTPHYLSPEQINGSRNIDEQADVWATGVVFYEMLTGHRAFDGANYQILAASILLDQPASIDLYRSEVPPELQRIVMRALAKPRDERYANAAQFRHALLTAWAPICAQNIARGRLLRKGQNPTPQGPQTHDSSDTEVNLPAFFDSSASVWNAQTRTKKQKP
jgi:serine/threonine-protein kinase